MKLVIIKKVDCIYMLLGWYMPNIFAFGLWVHQNLKKMSPFWPLSGWGHLWPQELYLHKLESPCPKVASYQIPLVCERNIFQIHNFPYCSLFLGPKRDQPFDHTLISIPQWCFLPNLVHISSMVLESERFKCISLYKPM